MEQEELFNQIPDLDIASRDDLLKILTGAARSPSSRTLEKMKAIELMCKIQGYFAPQQFEQLGEDGKPINVSMPTRIEIVGISTDKRTG
ncbi:hypothetical protein [Crenothrix polyspora]|uniref:Uncharacterized protein n=1 Tax=Crenothrix polyspora TaxID=360316 RepID=A0A1R4H148_9GAMM|nr:hypothetical protein [Crenothrix polyspora]SJM89977.1 hypothetical protein CRENPOLYSF1_1290006 [Crenothrix polyspora]